MGQNTWQQAQQNLDFKHNPFLLQTFSQTPSQRVERGPERDTASEMRSQYELKASESCLNDYMQTVIQNTAKPTGQINANKKINIAQH